MNIAYWLGFIGTGILIGWSARQVGITAVATDQHGLLIVVGGLAAAMFINSSFSQMGSAVMRFLSLFLPSRLPSIDESIAEVVKLARKAQREGGILSIQSDSREFADGFLHRAIVVAVASGESAEMRRIMEAEIRQLRIARQEDANFYRTMGVLSPMFGLLGTLIGMVRVLESMSDPTKAASAMGLALSSAFLGIGIANFFCVPVSGRVRLAAMKDALILEVLLEGALDIAAGKAPYLVELHLASYSARRRQELDTAGVAPAPGRAATGAETV